MPFIVTSALDRRALAATCRRYDSPAPTDGCIQFDNLEVVGWIVHLPGVQFPIAYDPTARRMAYHPRDNAFAPYARILRFIHRCYDVQARLRRGDDPRKIGHLLPHRPGRLLAPIGCR